MDGDYPRRNAQGRPKGGFHPGRQERSGDSIDIRDHQAAHGSLIDAVTIHISKYANPAPWHFLHEFLSSILPVPSHVLQLLFPNALGEFGSVLIQNRTRPLTDRPYRAARCVIIFFSLLVTLIETGILFIFYHLLTCKHSIYPS
jgi:hypothetical protein